MDKLVNQIQNFLMEDSYEVNLLIPFDKGDIFSAIKDKYPIDTFEYTDQGIDLVVSLDEVDYNIYKKYIKEI